MTINLPVKTLLFVTSILIFSTGWLAQQLQMSMVLHLLVQLPILIFLGYLYGMQLPDSLVERINRYNGHGIAGALLISGTGIFWMLPSALDASLSQWPYQLAKILSMSLLIGIAWSLTLKVIHPVLKGVFYIELWAMLARFGYLYKVSPERLCSNYLMDEQQMLGSLFLWLAVLIALYLSISLLTGFNVNKPTKS